MAFKILASQIATTSQVVQEPPTAPSVTLVAPIESEEAKTQESKLPVTAEEGNNGASLVEDSHTAVGGREESLSHLHEEIASDDSHGSTSGTPVDGSDIIAPPLAMSEIGTDESHASRPRGPLPSALFAIPFPCPVDSHRSKNTPPFLLYSPPRAIYQKPPKNVDGKRPKEKILKFAQRKFQEEVLMGEQIKRGEFENPTRFKKIRGACIRVASTLNRWLPDSCIETLSRLPPQRKLGSVTIIHPFFQRVVEVVSEGQDRPYEPTGEELLNDMGVLLRKTRKRVLTRAIIAGMLLPISLGIDVFAPVFAFEINLTYFAFQLYGLKKCKTLSAPRKHKGNKRDKRFKKKGKGAVDQTEEATLLVENSPAQVPQEEAAVPASQETFQLKTVGPPVLDPVLVLLYNICAKIDPVSFPPLPGREPENAPSDSPPSSVLSTLPPSLKRPGGQVVKDMIQAFRDTLPPDVADRYLLDEERVSEDLARYLKKAGQEYVSSLGGRGGRKGVIFRVKTWKKKSAVKKEQKAEVTRQKKKEKKQKAEATVLVETPVA